VLGRVERAAAKRRRGEAAGMLTRAPGLAGGAGSGPHAPFSAMPETPLPVAGRVLAVDLGSKRIGLAISEGTLALPLATLPFRSDRDAVAAIRAVAAEEGVAALVVGEPLRLDGSRGEAAERARAFAGKLAAASGLPCTLVDERLTSRAAEDRLRAAGVDPRRHRERVDQVAAQILLEEALGRRGGGG
jgi:putative Holliday junction resolvase